MSEDGLRPRPGPAPKLIEGPKSGNRSLYSQHVLDEDTYTDALSHIIQRDFFPTLPHIHATNDYLSALASNDPELLSSSIRRLAKIAADKEDGKGKNNEKGKGRGQGRADGGSTVGRAPNARNSRFDSTPYMSVGARGWDTPRTDRRLAPDEDGDGNGDVLGAGPSKRRKTAQPTPGPRIRDDLTLDAFQRNYTSEDNASFAQIVDEENLRRREEKSWAWDAQRASETKRIAGDERRKLILDAATNGGWRVDALGRRLIGGLGEGARSDQGAWGDRKLITAGESGTGSGSGSGTGNGNGDDAAGASDSDASPSDLNLSTALVRSDSSASDAPAGALIVSTASAASALAPAAITESSLPADHPLSRALATAGLPTTALVSTSDGAIVPHREAVSGSGDGRGRGDAEKEERAAVEKRVMGDEAREVEGTQQWKYKAMNSLMFLPDANENPYPKPKPPPAAKPPANPPTIAYRNTRLAEEEDEPSGRAGSTRRGSSPARSWIDAAVQGTEYIPRDERPAADDDGDGDAYSLIAEDADPDPEDLPPLMTWGTLLATPRRLDGTPDDLDGPAFRLPETKKRDELGRKLGAKASRAIADRARAYAAPGTPSTPSLTETLRAAASRTRTGDRSVRAASSTMLPPSTPRREDNLTPAARSLFDRSLGRTPQRAGGLGLGSGAKARGAATEKGTGWGRGGGGGRSWTPGSARR